MSDLPTAAPWYPAEWDWPEHLRDDAPYQRCGRCGRKTWDAAEFDNECRMTQPDGYPCGGRFEARLGGRGD